MIKIKEIEEESSCLNKAHDGELIFVLLERDVSSADAVEFWV